jgi:hypothetical protein
MPVLQEARNRGLGEIDIDKITITGNIDIETPQHLISESFKEMSEQYG